MLYTCINYLPAEESHHSRDVKIQCNRRAEHSSSFVGVKSGDIHSRASFAQHYGNYVSNDIYFLCIPFYSSNKHGFHN